jgi:hypothetical protein
MADAIEPAPIEVVLRPLCHAVYELGATHMVSTGATGTRLVSEITSARYEGERFKASTIGGANADWATIDPDGRVLVDVRLTLQTDDGAIVHVHYEGRGDAATGVTCAAPLFETGDERYAWLTRIQAVGKSVFDGTKLEYEIFEVA